MGDPNLWEGLRCSRNNVTTNRHIERARGVRIVAFAAITMAVMATAALSGCSTTEEQDEYSLKYELCREGDVENMDCPE